MWKIISNDNSIYFAAAFLSKSLFSSLFQSYIPLSNKTLTLYQTYHYSLLSYIYCKFSCFSGTCSPDLWDGGRYVYSEPNYVSSVFLLFCFVQPRPEVYTNAWNKNPEVLFLPEKGIWVAILTRTVSRGQSGEKSKHIVDPAGGAVGGDLEWRSDRT